MGLEEATNLKHALEMVEVCRSGLEYKQDIRPPSRDFIALGDQITELEGQFDIVQQCAKDNAIALGQQQEIVEKGAKILYARITELEAQRDELLGAAMGVLKIVQNAYHSDDRGPSDQCSILENAIEKVTGKKWWDAIKQPVVDG